MPSRTLLLDERALGRTLVRMATEIVERCGGTDDLVLVGIQRRGVELADRLKRLIDQSEGSSIASGKLDITLYRDDLQTVGPRPVVGRDPPAQSRRPHGGDRGRRALHRPHGPRGARRVRRLRSAAPDPAVRPDRPRRPRAADPGRHRRRPTVTHGPGDRVDVLVDGARRPRRGRAGAGADVSRAELGKDLVGLEPLSADQIRLILDTAEPFKEVSERAIKKVPALRGKTIVNLFFEASTRTRISFEFAEKRLCADTVNVAAVRLVGLQGRDAGGHRAQPRGDADRHGRDPPRRLGRGAVPRPADPRPTSSTPATASTSTRRRGCSTSSRCATGSSGSRDSRSPSAATSSTAAWPGATSGACTSSAPRSACAVRATLLPRNVHELGVTVLPRIEDAIQWADALNVLRLQLERMQGGLHPVAARIQPRVRRHARAARRARRRTS